MRSSTSSSETRIFREERSGFGLDRWSILLIATCAGWFILVESLTAVGFHRLSKIQHRIAQEYRAAVVPIAAEYGSTSDVLLVGNSLLEAGIDLHRLRTFMPLNWQVKRLVIESTTYMDWYYGLRRLLEEGARPNVVCLMLSWQQLAATEVRGEYFAHYLMLTRDFFRLVQDLKLSPTAASNLLFGRFSAFYSARVEIRKYLLSEIIPDLEKLTTLITPPRKPFQQSDLGELVTSRLQALKRAAGAYGIPIIFILAPTQGNAHAREIQSAGLRAEVPVVIGWSSRDFSADDYSDGFHLDTRGARKYTEILGAQLIQLLQRLGSPRAVMSAATN